MPLAIAVIINSILVLFLTSLKSIIAFADSTRARSAFVPSTSISQQLSSPLPLPSTPPTLNNKFYLKMADQQQQPPPSTSTDNNNSTTAVTTSSTSTAASRAIDFLTSTRTLKTTKRTGWVMNGVNQPESIADHMYRMTLMSLVASNLFNNNNNKDDSDGNKKKVQQLDVNKCIKLALIHDLAEANVGDITPHCGVSDSDKYNMELSTMESIQGNLGPMMGGPEILALWKEYEAGETEEARLVKDLDKIEMILQAQEYEMEGNYDTEKKEGGLDQFFSSTEGKWRTEIGKVWAEEIVSRRRRLKTTNEKVKEEE